MIIVDELVARAFIYHFKVGIFLFIVRLRLSEAVHSRIWLYLVVVFTRVIDLSFRCFIF